LKDQISLTTHSYSQASHKHVMYVFQLNTHLKTDPLGPWTDHVERNQGLGGRPIGDRDQGLYTNKQ